MRVGFRGPLSGGYAYPEAEWRCSSSEVVSGRDRHFRRGARRRECAELADGTISPGLAKFERLAMSSTLTGEMGRSRKQRSTIHPPGQAIPRIGSAGRRPAVLLLIGASTLIAALILTFRFSAGATLSGTIQTGLVVCGLLSAWFIWIRSTCTRQVFDFLLLGAVLTLTLAQLVFFADPAMLRVNSSASEAAVPLFVQLAAAVMFAAAALTRRSLIATRRQTTVRLATPVAAAAAMVIGALLLYGHSGWFRPVHEKSTALVVALAVPSVVLMIVAAAGFARSALRHRNIAMALLGAAAILLAACWSRWLFIPALTPNSVAGRTYLCAGAFWLILLFALISHTQLQRARAEEATAVERRRLVCDLHDGMAQDLAFIATYAEHLVQDFGLEHPLTVAARRALAASRGFITDLAASDAPNTACALRAVANELSFRHGVAVTVEAHGGDLTPRTREAVVRIAREAIVNAVRHGHAQHIAVTLDTHGDEFTLRISDDGLGPRSGVSGHAHRGFGLRAMRERAQAVGGDLLVRERSDGGTAVEAVVS
jgi:signal transduction histidine kinase